MKSNQSDQPTGSEAEFQKLRVETKAKNKQLMMSLCFAAWATTVICATVYGSVRALNRR
ncbi:hypothetical protein [Levilactobacillus bambusae]|uniref:hypothetical protein n=1 Tax=Levilactobacillus bambusae TaxID=2024736 RepID=UPI0014028F4F|nr:hypothetical protein [Levilactobacillus bambusae]